MFGSAASLRRQLLVLALATILPLLLFGSSVVFWSSHLHGAAARQGFENTARALSVALDEQIETWKAALTALSTSPALDHDNYAAFHRQADAVAKIYGGWIAVSLPSGRQVVNTLEPIGAEPSLSHSAGLLPTVLQDGAAHVSGLFVGPASNRHTLAVTVPAVRDGVVTHALHLGFFPENLAEVLANQHLPAGWIAALLDDRRRVIARTPHVADFVGTQAPAWYTQGRRGLLEGRALDGTAVYGAFERLPNVPWVLVLLVPGTELEQAWQRPLALMAGGGAILATAIFAIFFLMGSRLTRPIDELAAAARAVTRGEPLPAIPETNLRELNSLRNAVVRLSQKQVLLREVNHRIKNGLQLVSSLLGLQSRAIADGVAQTHLREARTHIQAIARLHERLYKADQYEVVDAFALARAVCDDIATISAGRARLQVAAPEGVAHMAADVAGPFALIIAELATNAVKYASEAGRVAEVNISCRAEGERMISVLIADDGLGLPPDFDLAAQKGTGLRMCLMLASQIGGALRALPAERGALFELRVPAAGAAASQHGLETTERLRPAIKDQNGQPPPAGRAQRAG